MLICKISYLEGGMARLRSIDNYKKQNVKGLLLKNIWPWNLEPLRSRSQTKVTMGRTRQGLSTSEVQKSYWPWCRYNEVKSQLHIWPWNLEHSRSRSQMKVTMERIHQGISKSEVLKSIKSYWPYGLGIMNFISLPTTRFSSVNAPENTFLASGYLYLCQRD